MSKENREKKIAKEIVMIFKKAKISLFTSVFYFIAYSFYNKLIKIALFNYKFAWFEAKEIFNGFLPSQYVFKSDNLDKWGNGSGRMEISTEGYLEVKKRIIVKLSEDSIEFALIMIVVTFLLLLFFHYSSKAVKWVIKHSK